MNRLLSLTARLCFAFVAGQFLGPDSVGETVRVVTFNLWVGGDEGRQPLSQTVEVIRAAKADMAGLQECHGFERDNAAPDNGRKVAELLGWQHFDQGGRTAIISRFPIVTNTPLRQGVKVRLPGGREVWMFNAHLAHAPYQPYQLLSIPYGDGRFIKAAEEAVEESRKARGAQVERFVSELKPLIAAGSAVFMTGDFNEPSHQDWTSRAAAAGLCPLAVEYPSTLAVTKAGMTDAYRLFYPDERKHPGRTWTPITRLDDPKDRHDRIDFVFAGGAEFDVNDVKVIGEDSTFADVAVRPYPSDHRAVAATIELR